MKQVLWLTTMSLVTVGSLPADDLLQKARQERELATQQAEAQVRQLLTRSKELPAAEALSELKNKLESLQSSRELEPERKEKLLQALDSRIRILEAEARTKGDTSKPASPNKQMLDSRQREELERQKAEIERLKEGVNRVNQLLGQRKTQEAEAAAQELLRNSPNSPAAKVFGHNISLQARIRDAKELIARQERQLALTLRDAVSYTHL
ncbi:MAG: hypothetical protein N2039_11630, partial [Gemmataceae bacterium]|nr:hypothetical protein [Gemmataceae bacterium]